jgi:phosphoribosylaminoimidazolecarboxamide formyltransferase/IMP cyclohydrolase
MDANGIGAIDLVVMNLYPFEQTVASGGDFEKCVENIDIGGPSMLRSSAKNHAYVTILTSPSQYAKLMDGTATHPEITFTKPPNVVAYPYIF